MNVLAESLGATPIEVAAQRLREAYTAGPIAPRRDLIEPTDVDGGYAIQTANTRHWLGQGRRIDPGAACMAHPLNAVEWLARALAGRGEPLRAGDVVMSGALGPMVPFSAGASVRVAIGGLGSAEFHYKES